MAAKIQISLETRKINVLLMKSTGNYTKDKRSLDSQLAEEKLTLMQHPIFRIFYVSHDSQDLKIWSYIARDGPSNVFKCHVFKAFKKSQAMRIVRTIGQAFEVCHKISITSAQADNQQSNFPDDCDSETLRSMKETKDKNNQHNANNSIPMSTPEKAFKQAQDLLYAMAAKTPGKDSIMTSHGGDEHDSQLPLTNHYQIQLLRDQLEMQQHQTQLAIAQVHLLKDQLAAESAARIEAQARAHQLLVHNRELLEHMAQLVTRIQDLEVKVNGVSTATENLLPPLSQLQVSWIPDPTTPQSGPVYTPDGNDFDFDNSFVTNSRGSPYKNKMDDTDSPDSGHKEMSTENLNYHSNRVVDPVYWPSILRGQVSVSSPDALLTQNHFAGIASITGNPFANGFDDSFNQNTILQCSYEEKMKIITPIPPHDASGNRLELKLNKAPKIDPPPEFRNSKSFRDSQISAQSTDSASSQETNPMMKSDSDYYSNTTGSAHSHINNNFMESGNHSVSVHSPPRENISDTVQELFPDSDLPHISECNSGKMPSTSNYNNNQNSILYQNTNNNSRQISDGQFTEKYKQASSTLDSIQKLELQLNRMNLDQKSASDYCLRTLNNGQQVRENGTLGSDKSFRVKTIPPPPPPRRTGSLSSEGGS